MRTIFHDIVNLLTENQSFALATVCNRSGSAPRAVGARMVALPDGAIRGTIGGGLLEAQVLQVAPQVLQARRARMMEFRMTGKGFSKADPEMICGGRAEVLVEYADADDQGHLNLYHGLLAAIELGLPVCLITALPAQAGGEVGRCLLKPDGSVLTAGAPLGDQQFLKGLAEAAGRRQPELVTREQGRFLVEPICDQGTVYILGAGHIGQKLAPLCGLVSFKTVVLDDRQAYANREVFDTADRVIVLDSFEHALKDVELDAQSYVVIVTRGHIHDKTVLAQALRTKARYIGMIGSRRKRDTVYQALMAEGFTAQDVSRVYSPIGLSIGSETPEEIAVSIVAEMIQVRAGLQAEQK